jgi:acetyl-CoA carboxylase carboxyltransferase component
MSLSKQMRMQYLSAALRLPSILLMDSSGAYLPLQAEIFNRGGRTFYNEAMLGAQGLPQVTLLA